MTKKAKGLDCVAPALPLRDCLLRGPSRALPLGRGQEHGMGSVPAFYQQARSLGKSILCSQEAVGSWGCVHNSQDGEEGFWEMDGGGFHDLTE